MNTLRMLCLLIATISMLVLNSVALTCKDGQKVFIRGSITFPDSPKTVIESDAKLTVELQDIAHADAAAKVITKVVDDIAEFPKEFTIKFLPLQITEGHRYSLSVSIRNKKNELLYINDVIAQVIPLGTGRTKYIDVPVILIKKTTPSVSKQQWPELVGEKGEDAVKIIKQETGFTNVVTIQEGSPMTMDFRTDRVRVIITDKDIVASTPTIG
ncbi:unnamed protein product [Adineta steineri]|uniref:Uncharacterized protein n=1 Tax=Adineta steineri TaxID=433720 RepID=A0A815PML2_9BILA|nr:unnamed protein product [Adineta steineri]CAF1630656.1 unnamed protein product [Adineta steineri]